MGRDFVLQAAEFPGLGNLDLLAQIAHFLQQQVDLLLLAINGQIQLFEQILGETDFDFELGEARFHGESFGDEAVIFP